MATITEDYVSFETAKLLKEKGFDELCNKKYNGYKSIVPAGRMIELWQNSEFDDDEECSAPTLQMACKWLREVHKLHIEPHIQSYKNYNGNIYNLDGELLLGFPSESPEQACEAAILYCLRNLI